MKFLQTTLLSLVLCGAVSALAGTKNDQIRDYLEEKRLSHGIPGLSWAVMEKGKLLSSGGLGQASVEFSIAADEDTVYPISSTSKMFAGVATMLLVEDGKLSLETKARQLIGELPESWAEITVRQLLNHTSGITDFYRNKACGFPDLNRKKTRSLDHAAAMAYTYPFPLQSKPGEKWSYSVAGYVLLGWIIETVSGTSYTEFVEGRILTPLGLKHSFYGSSERVVANRNPVLYLREDKTLVNRPITFNNFVYTAAGLNCQVLDLARFLDALAGGNILNEESLKDLWQPAMLGDAKKFPYGLGFSVGKYREHRVVSHEGGGQSWNLLFPDLGLSVVVICNLSGARADEVVDDIADMFLPAKAEVTP